MIDLEKLKNDFEGKEFTILRFEQEVQFSYGLHFFADEFYKDIKANNKTIMGHYRDKVDFYHVSAKIIKDGKEGYHDTIVKILKIEL